MELKGTTIKHLEMIQAIVNRMAQNSFLLKAWTITIMTGTFLVSIKNESTALVFILLLIPIFVFWILDGYFLNQERLFRYLFDSVRKEQETSFSMKTDPNYSDWSKAFFSKTLLIFYGGILSAYLCFIILLKCIFN